METAWLIEIGQMQGVTPPVWFSGLDVHGKLKFDCDPLLAIRFARRDDAARMIAELDIETGAFEILEHGWG